MQKPDALLHTKIRLPSTRPSLVPRPRLQEQIMAGLRDPLTLVIAPAGFGKTTLVASCIAGCGLPVAWLSLDKDDNQLERFLRYVIASLQEVDAGIGVTAAQLLTSSPSTSPRAILTSLINDLDSNSHEIALVLDDYQFISSQAVHEQLAFLLEHCPGTLRLVIATRSDPALPLARMRARGHTLELRGADLSFTEQEAAQFLNGAMGLCLDARSVAVLKQRTEGWIAGLQMAALSMRDRKDVPAFIEAFSGTNRYILDYLLEEVLAGQSPQVQRFLLYTSILERLSAPLCDALLAGAEELQDGYAPGTSGSTSTLDYLERANLFLVPLDDERTWYRYHQLFADLLRTQLQKLIGERAVAGLHRRTAEWHEKYGSVLDAIHHAALASDDEMSERLIEQSYLEMVSRGEMYGLRFWSNQLNRELVYRRPQLCIYEAYSHGWFGELDEADSLLEIAEKRLQAEPSLPGASAMLGHLTYVKSRLTALHGNLPRAIELNYKAREYLPVTNVALQLDLGITLGYLYFLHGDFSPARHYLDETVRVGRSVGAILNTVAGYCIMARLCAAAGQLRQSHEIYEQAAGWIRGIGGQHLGASSLVEVGLAETFYERNDLESALAHVTQGLAFIHLWAKADDLVLACVTKARIHMAQADFGAAALALERARQVIHTRGLFTEAPAATEAAQVRLWLAQGDIGSASDWAALWQERLVDKAFKFEDEPVRMALVRVWISARRSQPALELLSRLEETAGAAGRTGRLLEILILKALALQQHSDPEGALLVLTEALKMAESEGYMRIFLDEGEPVRMLLARWLASASPSALRSYATRMLSAFAAEPTSLPAVNPPHASALIEPLSQRELEVLHLLALGRTNQEIADQLVVSAGTVKAHTANIYRKLDVANRTEAVSRSRQLQIIP